nr:ABC transporter ATP-binding protein [Anaerolineae bacterium]
MQPVIEINNLTKTYGDTCAVDDVSLAVYPGEIFGIVGPNGAGKTTTVELAIGLRKPDAGSIRVLGLDPQQDAFALGERIGVQLQQAALPDRMRVWEALDLFASFYRRSVAWQPLLDQWGLGDKRKATFASLSGGQQQRLFIALALVNDPELVVLDELTTGLDPHARRNTWNLVRAIRDQGKTVVLVTHFMDEAEKLCDRVAIFDQGRVVALDAPGQLIKSLNQGSRVRFTAPSGLDMSWLQEAPGVSRVDLEKGDVVVHGNGALMAQVAAALAQRQLMPPDLRSEQANLEDVFLAVTGRQMEENHAYAA